MRAISLNIITAAALLSSTALVLAQDSGGTGGFPGFGTPREARDDAPKPSDAPSSGLAIQTVDDSPAMAGFPEGTALDILGVELGMTPDEVRAAYTGPGRFASLAANDVFATNAENASEVRFQYPSKMEAAYPMALYSGVRPGETPGSNLVTAWFGSEAIGGRAYRIIRRFVPANDEPISVEAYKQQIIAKYGEPSGVDKFPNTLVWQFIDSEKSTLPGWPYTINQDLSIATYRDDNRNYKETKVPPCYYSLSEWIQQAGIYPEYKYLPNRDYLYEQCTGGLYVNLRGRERLESAVFIAVDHQRALANADELDRVINERLQTDTGAVSVPRL
ncbi:hypothetical protein VSX64_18015 [Aurantimonas sp. C2-6-R+9]|uniref:hypothetical protein n=1 Tax=unclassified Aurantimonas TaxID=2638230 RepID=UPI002E17DA32|nr:hypothetical protein [Aurantimonas sp. C2-6-R+9]